MFNGIFQVPQPVNEPVLNYAPGSPERDEVRAKLNELLGQQVPAATCPGQEEAAARGLARQRRRQGFRPILVGNQIGTQPVSRQLLGRRRADRRQPHAAQFPQIPAAGQEAVEQVVDPVDA